MHMSKYHIIHSIHLIRLILVHEKNDEANFLEKNSIYKYIIIFGDKMNICYEL